jgi:3-phenylpropionate/trans-cinnamate dioxygenase ferredoxin reductase subunit
MAGRRSCVILGGGVAAYSTAEALRAAGFDGPVTLVSAEPVAPYDRTTLSKAFLQGRKTVEEILFKPVDHYEGLGIELRLGERVTAVSLDRRELTLERGKRLPFDALVIVTGAEPVRLHLRGFDLDRVHYLRSLADAQDLANELAHAERVLVVGAGFIGAEVAASARALGKQVTVVDPLPFPLAGPLGEEVGSILAEVHRRHGVDLRLGRRLAELRGHRRVEEAVLEDGERIACDLVVTGVGVRPAVGLFEGSAVALENGILVDEHGATSVSGVYAAGDVTTWWHPVIGRRMRVEHFDHAVHQGEAVARAIAGDPRPYAPVPYFWSDQYDVNLQYVGYPGPWDQVVLRGDPTVPSVTAFYLRHQVVEAVVTINRPRELRPGRRLVEARARVDPAVLADLSTDLRTLAQAAHPSA